MMRAELTTRAAADDDLPAILALLRESMGRADDARFEALFRWKHLDNAFGRSPMWVACDGDRIVGLRTLMRWEFERDGEVFRCVRAVDTATHPEFQGRGIFRRLTLDALAALELDGVDFVFNTPNAQSLPGYLKMGWQELGRARASIRPLTLRAPYVIARSRVPASHWSEEIAFGLNVDDVLDDDATRRLIASTPTTHEYRTRTTAPFLAWRYGTPLLGYRAVVTADGIERGVAIVRVRTRGTAREVVLATILLPADGSRAALGRLLQAVRRAARGHADYLLGVGSIPGAMPLPRFGPIVTTRSVVRTAPQALRELRLALGDIELF
jgi:predicted N-acetyltransferase YhbS